VQQRRLPDPGLSPDDQRRALTRANTVQEAIDLAALAQPSAKGRRSWCGHPVTVGRRRGIGNTPGHRQVDGLLIEDEGSPWS